MNHVQFHKSTALLRIFSVSLKTVSKMWFEIAGVSDVTNDLVTNQVTVWLSTGVLVWVSGGGANLHFHRTMYTKW